MRAATGATVHMLFGHRAQVRDIRFSPDGALVGSRSDDGELIVWETATGRPLQRWGASAPWGVGFSPDGDLVYEGGSDSMLRTWDRSMEQTYLQQTTQVGADEVFAHADLSPDAQQVAYRWIDESKTGWVTFVDITTGDATTPTQLPTEEVPWSLGTWKPDGEQYLGWRTNGVATVLDTSTGDVVGDTEPFGGIYSAAYVDGDGSLLAGDVAGRTHLLDADSLLAEGAGFEFAAEFVNPIGDGSAAMVGARSADGTVVQ